MRWLSDATLDHLREVADLPDLSETKYRLLREIGRGGMGTVYLAEDQELGREVALKVLSAPDPDAARRMAQEARIVASLEHPGIVPIHDAGALPDGRVFYAMKRVRGSRLDEHPDHALPAILRIFERICEAVAFAHAHGVIHRDLKPENVMVGAFGEVLVMDWGVAKLTGRPSRELSGEAASEAGPAPEPLAATPGTQAGSAVGTPGYMAPEQASGLHADERSDIFALGGILHYLLTRRHPRPGEEPAAGIPPSESNRVPRALEAVCRKAMDTEPGKRYATARDMGADIARYLEGEGVSAHRETLWERFARVAYRHRAWILLVLAYLLMRALLLVFRGR